jgi:hypothetical protein
MKDVHRKCLGNAQILKGLSKERVIPTGALCSLQMETVNHVTILET